MKALKTGYFVVLLIFCCQFSVFAQGPGFDEDVEDEPTPIDGGVSLLLAAGAGYGIKKLIDARKDGKSEMEL